ncbi:MAG: beta-galactosidase [Acidobacteriia bacterium]|nr:beta-galactosidase [Terriglobia bacterium]
MKRLSFPAFWAVFCCAVISLGAQASSPSPAQKPPVQPQASATAPSPGPALPRLILGAAWYPEQWPEARWEEDLTLMQAAGIRMVRVAEFAWSRMESQEGKFDFAWLERAVALAARHDILVVLGTPTAAPPAWLTQKYPETLVIDENGRRATHGNRQQCSLTSVRYRELARRIAEGMAQRFGHNPHVIGWQIDNEYGPVSYDEDTRRQFQQWLKARYKTLDSLNQHWTTSYWSETYDNWQEIPIPVGEHNPGLKLEWQRFITDSFRDFNHNQVTAIRAHADPRQFITHNFMGWYDVFDHYILSADLDLASWDDYVGTGHLNPASNALLHDLTRGFKRKNFWVMETQPGSVNWAPVNNSLDRGEVRDMAWEAIGHGADAVSYWQWRSALGGQEEYHGTLVGADGKPVPLYEEIVQIGKEFAKVGENLRGTSPAAATALLQDYDSRWAIQFQKHNQDFDTFAHFRSYYRPLQALTQAVDVVHPSAPLASYRLVVAPHLNVLPDGVANHLREFVQGGGHLVLGPRSGMKDAYNALLPSRQPGTILGNLLGGDVRQFYALEKPAPVSGQGGEGEAKIWAEMLETTAPDADVLVRYGKSNGWLDGQPAVITRRVGAGRITYIGAWLDDKTMDSLAAWMIQVSQVKPALGAAPEGVEVCRRVGSGKEVFIVINHTTEPQTISLPRPMREALRGGDAASSITLPPREVGVLLPAE